LTPNVEVDGSEAIRRGRQDKPGRKGKACSSLKFRTATWGENPTGDDGDRHAGSESCEIVRKYTGDRDLEA